MGFYRDGYSSKNNKLTLNIYCRAYQPNLVSPKHHKKHTKSVYFGNELMGLKWNFFDQFCAVLSLFQSVRGAQNHIKKTEICQYAG